MEECMTINKTRLDVFTSAYLITALWASFDDDDIPLDTNYTIDDFDPETLASMKEDCRKFFEKHQHQMTADCRRTEKDDPEGMAGHDFWLSRNHHGAGFYDGDWHEPAWHDMSATADWYGEYTLYVENDIVYGE
jgi:hypothetical protein